MALSVIEKKHLTDFVNRLIATQPAVIGPVRKGSKLVFGPLSQAQDLVLDYVTTILPPKKYLLPPQETLIRFKLGPSLELEPVIENTPRIILGVHPCDLRGIWSLDQAFGDDTVDTHYTARRRATTLIGVDCHPDESCFCTSVGSQRPEAGTFDLFLTDIGSAYVVEIGSERGRQLLERYAQTREATANDLALQQRFWREKEAAMQAHLNGDVHLLPLLLDSQRQSDTWKELGNKCLSCGNCNLVCPTCYCFDVGDLMQLNLTDGERVRQWDGCTLTDFAVVAGGHNFRRQTESRVRHRYYRKFQYLMLRYGKPFCTGCGRCTRSCLVHINPPDTLNALIAASEKEEA